MGYFGKNVSHLEKCFTIGKMRHPGKIGSQLEKWVTLGEMDLTWKSGSHWEKWITMEKWVTFETMSHTLKELFTLGKLCLN